MHELEGPDQILVPWPAVPLRSRQAAAARVHVFDGVGWELDARGTRRFAELRRGLPGVSEKVFIQHLRAMEVDGLVCRRVYAEVPPRVEYSLTEHGTSLNQALGPLGTWGKERLRRERSELVEHRDARALPRP